MEFVGAINDGLYNCYTNNIPGSRDFARAIRPLVSFPMADYALDNSGDTIKIVKRS